MNGSALLRCKSCIGSFLGKVDWIYCPLCSNVLLIMNEAALTPEEAEERVIALERALKIKEKEKEDLQ